MTRWRRGDAARVADLSGLKLPKGKPPFAEGDIIRVAKVSDDGSALNFNEHPGWFLARRFTPL